MIIDSKIRVNVLTDANLTPGANECWSWLLRILVERNYCTQKLWKYCLKVISNRKLGTSFVLEHALASFYSLLVIDPVPVVKAI